MKNEIMIVRNIENRIKAKREPTIFPLTPTHRKELRQLRDTNVGNLMDRMRTLKQLKREEYKKKYNKEIIKELDSKRDICNFLNEDWKKRIKKINKILQERKAIEKKTDMKFLETRNSWSDIAKLEPMQKDERFASIRVDFVTNQIADGEFEKKFGFKFDEVQKQITDIDTKYEEAINFGDLEIVKELYYIMKTADSFFEKVSKIEV